MELIYELRRETTYPSDRAIMRTARRADIAKQKLVDMVYEAVHDNALLDREAGVNEILKAKSFEITKPDIGHIKSWVLTIGHNEITLEAKYVK